MSNLYQEKACQLKKQRNIYHYKIDDKILWNKYLEKQDVIIKCHPDTKHNEIVQPFIINEDRIFEGDQYSYWRSKMKKRIQCDHHAHSKTEHSQESDDSDEKKKKKIPPITDITMNVSMKKLRAKINRQ